MRKTYFTYLPKLSDFVGSWIMSDSETDEFMKQIKKRWSEWKVLHK